jgi:hypothetical protein
MDIVHGIGVDYSRDKLFDELGIKRLKESYMKDEEVSPQERFSFRFYGFWIRQRTRPKTL